MEVEIARQRVASRDRTARDFIGAGEDDGAGHGRFNGTFTRVGMLTKPPVEQVLREEVALLPNPGVRHAQGFTRQPIECRRSTKKVIWGYNRSRVS